MAHLEEASKGAKQHVTDTSSTTRSAGPCGPHGRADCTAAWTYSRPSFLWVPLKISRPLGKWAGATEPDEEYVSAKI